MSYVLNSYLLTFRDPEWGPWHYPLTVSPAASWPSQPMGSLLCFILL